MLDRKVLLEKMQQFGIDWIGSSGFLDEGQVSHILDIVEHESSPIQRALDEAGLCVDGKEHDYAPSTNRCVFCDTPRKQREPLDS